MISDSIQANKTTLCLVPCGTPHDGNLTTERRTMKVMKASLSGIPIVSLAWVDACLAARQIVAPTAEMYVRTLSAKSTVLSSPIANQCNFGVALLAAALDDTSTKSHGLLSRFAVFLAGFSSQNESAFVSLLRSAGAVDVIVNKQTAVSKLKAMSKDETMIVLCGESPTIKLSDALEREIRSLASKVLVVGSQWLIDSVSCGFPVDPDFYPPQGGGLVTELWKITTTK
jgi:hypothetical protein